MKGPRLTIVFIIDSSLHYFSINHLTQGNKIACQEKKEEKSGHHIQSLIFNFSSVADLGFSLI